MKKAEATRLEILQKAFELVYRNGYQATSVNDILATTHVTKGAFYFHFENKDAMGLAIIEELLKPQLNKSFMAPLQLVTDPIDAIYGLFHHLLLENDFLQPEWGCPVANFTQEMGSWNKQFGTALQELTLQWEKALTAIINKGKRDGKIRKNVNAKQVAAFLMAGYWGVRNFAKLGNSEAVYKAHLQELKQYLRSLA